MPYALLLVSGGLIVMLGMKGCEMVLDRTLGEPIKKIEKTEPNTGLPGETIKKALVFTAGGLAVITSVYITKKIFS